MRNRMQRRALTASSRIAAMKIERCATVIALLCSFVPQVRGAAQPRPVRFVSWGGIGGAARAQAAARIGVDTHRLPVGWPDATGRYDFEDFDRRLRWLREAGINVVVHFFNHGVPDWFWMSHFVRERERHYAARYPLYYMRRLKKLGRATVVQVSVVPGWQTKENIAGLKALGLRVIGEIYITPTAEQQREHARLAWNLGCDGFFVGTLENLFHEDGTPTAAGRETARIIRNWRHGTAP